MHGDALTSALVRNEIKALEYGLGMVGRAVLYMERLVNRVRGEAGPASSLTYSSR